MFLQRLAEWFPTPSLLYPPAVGLDITDASVKWLELVPHKNGLRLGSYGFEPLAEGIVSNGAIRDVEGLAAALKRARMQWRGSACAHAALPEEAAYVFQMHVPNGSSREDILSMIEFEFEARVPIPPEQAVFDFDIVAEREAAGTEIAVVVFPRELAERYVEACKLAGIELLSLELEARSIARAIWRRNSKGPAMLLADFGRERTGFAIIKNGVPIFTTTVGVGGRTLTNALVEKIGLSEDEARAFKNDHGVIPTPGVEAGTEAAVATAASLSDEILQHYHFWNTRRDERGERATPLGGVCLVGGSANLKGLVEYIAGRVRADVVRPNVWRNVCDFDEYIPPIERHISLQYPTVIGLALRGLHS